MAEEVGGEASVHSESTAGDMPAMFISLKLSEILLETGLSREIKWEL